MGNEYRHGHQVEDVLLARLQRHGCDVVSGEDLNHTHKLDFVVSRFDGIARMRPVGVQVTTRTGAVDKMSEFLFHQQRHPYTERALYVELVDFETDEIAAGVDLIVYSALIHFTFSTAFLEDAQRVYGFRVRKDWSTEFFDLRQDVERLRAIQGSARSVENGAPATVPVSPVTPTVPSILPAAVPLTNTKGREAPLTTTLRAALLQSAGIDESSQPQRQPGVIVKLNSRGFGFLDTPNGKRYFFSLSQVTDLELRAELEKIQVDAKPWADHLRIPVAFKNCGMVRRNAQHPMADRIARRESGTGSAAS
ncbi:hypothetical protein HY480_05165 [Candidatus Uhrbacteria bacterium]|nr:hypothetical protein [Candidatus Uhrbacteria bacterium]